MAGLHKPVGKLSRRLGVGITFKGEQILKRRPYRPGQHGNSSRPAKTSDYARQLTEKQKFKAFYGLRESQFRRILDEAVRRRGNTGENLLILLELRLDNVVYRQGLCNTRRQARQLVNHGHFEVNGRRVDIPSYRVRVGDVIRIAPGSIRNGFFRDALREDLLAVRRPAEWLEQSDASRTAWTISRLPRRDEAEQQVEEQAVVEFYSR